MHVSSPIKKELNYYVTGNHNKHKINNIIHNIVVKDL